MQTTLESPGLCGKILIIDDEPDIVSTLSGILSDEGHKVSTAFSGAQGLKLVAQELPEVCFLDVWLPDGDGLDFLEKIRVLCPETSMIMISGHATIETAVKCTRLGAIDFIEKPLSLDKVVLSVQNALRFKNLRSENQNLRNRFEQKTKLIGTSKAMEGIQSTIEMVAPKNSTVLITGENGTGKENVARLIHERSHRAKKPFIAINCAAIPEELIESELFGHQKGAFTGAVALKRGKFELANGGTLLLDEIGDMSLKTQSKVLRVLQEQKFERIGGDESIHVDVRVLAATNKVLEQSIRQGTFREDLFYRLNVIPIVLPALRERKEDIEAIATHYLDHFSAENSIHRKVLSRTALECLKEYAWPGNIRELKNIMERLSIMVSDDIIEPFHLPSPISTFHTQASGVEPDLFNVNDLRIARAEFERIFIFKKIEECGGNISKTADLIGLERSHLYRKLKQFESDSDNDRKQEMDKDL
jgi:two-component system nitrogen regulation response regulator NtrX